MSPLHLVHELSLKKWSLVPFYGANLYTYFLKLHHLSFPLMSDSNTVVTAFTSENIFILDHPILVFNKIAVILEMPGDIKWAMLMVSRCYFFTLVLECSLRSITLKNFIEHF